MIDHHQNFTQKLQNGQVHNKHAIIIRNSTDLTATKKQYISNKQKSHICSQIVAQQVSAKLKDCNRILPQ